MEYVKPGYVAPTYPVQPMPMPAPQPMPAPMPIMHQPTPIMHHPAPIMHKPVHNDIHLHASYQQTSFVFPKPHHHHHPVAVQPVATCSNYNSTGSILVLFILLVIITRGLFIQNKC